MSVYVDELNTYETKLRYKVWCHMTADSEDELHAMADLIGLKREWFQARTRTPHYDLVPSKRALAVKHGAIEETGRARVRRIRASAAEAES